MAQEFRSIYAKTNGIKLHTIQAGKENNPHLILLHGFPEFWYGWHQQIIPLANAGYHVIVPDQRGCNLSDKPRGIRAYQIKHLVADIIGLMDSFGDERVYLAAHDWGAMIAWYIAMWHPNRLEKLIIANVPHPYVYWSFFRTHPEQWLKSWYAGFFQIPALPELLIKVGNFAVLSHLMQRETGLSKSQMQLYHEAWSQSGALRSMLNWYRAFAQYPPKRINDGCVRVPTLMLWGMNDIALAPGLSTRSIAMCDDGKLIQLPNTGHFIQHLKPDVVTDTMIDFLRGE